MKNFFLNLTLLILFGLITACGLLNFENDDDPVPSNSVPEFSPPSFTRTTLLSAAGPTTPVLWQGNLIYVLSSDQNPFLELRDIDLNLIGSNPWLYGLGSAIVVGSRLYVFGTDTVNHQAVYMTYSDDLALWSTPVLVLTPYLPSQTLYHTSVIAIDTGYLMACEVSEPGIALSFRFLTSPDLTHWAPIGGLFDIGYSANPTVRLLENTYFILYTKIVNHQFQTFLAQTKDFFHFFTSPHPILTPESDENDASFKADLIEYSNSTYIVYVDGNRIPNLKQAEYSGSMSSLFNLFFE